MIFLITLYSIIALEQPHVKNFLQEASKNGIYTNIHSLNQLNVLQGN